MANLLGSIIGVAFLSAILTFLTSIGWQMLGKPLNRGQKIFTFALSAVVVSILAWIGSTVK